MHRQYENKATRERHVGAYSKLVRQLIDEGREPYYLNFMFSHIQGSLALKRNVMIHEVERVHDILTRNTVRWTKSEAWQPVRPIFIGCFDWPVWKHAKVSRSELSLINGGLHFNAVALLPPKSRPTMNRKLQNLLWGRQSRLTVPLDVHFQSKRAFYENDILSTIHVESVTRGTMMDYTLKAFKHGRETADSIEIWN